MLPPTGHDCVRFQQNDHEVRHSAFMYDYYSAILCCAARDASLLLRLIHMSRIF